MYIDDHQSIGGAMSRVQLALNVSDLDASVSFYTALFGVPPAKTRPGYANFAVVDPPLKLVLIERPDARGTGISGALNHLGVEVGAAAEVTTAAERFRELGLATTVELDTTCCYAVQDKAWVADPDEMPWEIYTVLGDAPLEVGSCGDGASVCCQIQPLTASNCCGGGT
jgi:catechol 2,3-dioxygenase-like lactoylglutathione lyase family enzyme